MLNRRIKAFIWFSFVIIIYIYSDSYFALFSLIMFLSILIFWGISTRLLINNLEFKLKGPDTLVKDRLGDFYIKAYNKGILPISKIKCTLQLRNILTKEEREETIYISLNSKEKNNIYWNLKSKYCGKIEIKIKEIIIYDYFGIFKNRIDSNINKDLLILPKTFNVDIDLSKSHMDNLESPLNSNMHKGIDNTEIFGIREYIPGDNIRNIHWKLTSKLDNLIIKELGSTVESSILIIWETSILNNKCEVPSVTDAMIEVFISISKSLVEQGQAHSIGWFDYKSNSFRIEGINSIDDLSVLIRGFLEIEKKENSYSAIDYYLNIEDKYNFSHIVYIRPENENKYLKNLKTKNPITVLQCQTEELKNENIKIDYDVVFTPENIKERLSYLVI